jgi:hypothetical protein
VVLVVEALVEAVQRNFPVVQEIYPLLLHHKVIMEATDIQILRILLLFMLVVGVEAQVKRVQTQL